MIGTDLGRCAPVLWVGVVGIFGACISDGLDDVASRAGGRPAVRTISVPPESASPVQPSPQHHVELGRRIVGTWLIDELDKASIRPGMDGGASPKRCFSVGQAKNEAPVMNPLSPILSSFRTHHWRLGQRVGPNRRDIRDVFAFDLPRNITWSLMMLKEPRLEFSYRIGCRRPGMQAWVDVTVSQRGNPLLKRRVPLGIGSAAPMKPWREVALDVPEILDEALELTLAFGVESEHGSREAPVIAIANPRVTGRPKNHQRTQDLSLILVIVDALRGDLVGPDRRTDLPDVAPHLNRFIRRGAYFNRAFAVSNQTRASTLSILTSQPPSLGGFRTSRWLISRDMRERYYGVGSADRPPLLTRTLRAAGYMPVTIGHNRFLFVDHPMGLDAGFDRNLNDSHRALDTARLTEDALDFLDRHRHERFLLYLNLVTPHLPYMPPQHHLDQVLAATGGNTAPSHVSSKYLAEVAYADAQLGRLFDRLDAHGLTERTLVVVTADHGEVFNPAHACWSARFGQNCHGNHGLTLYGEEMHVPLAFVGPPSIRPGTVARGDVSLLNVAPTILDILGLPEDRRHVGRSLRPELEGRNRPSEPIYAEARRSVAFQSDDWKLHVHHPKDDAWPPARRGLQTEPNRKPDQKRFQLFDLSKDPHEFNNLALGGHSRLQIMLDKMGQHRAWMAQRVARGGDTAQRLSREGPLRFSGPARNTFFLRSDGGPAAFIASISATPAGRLRCLPASQQGVCQQVDSRTVRLALTGSNGGHRVEFESAPWDEPLTFSATLNGSPLDQSDLRVGSFGLKLFNAQHGFRGGFQALRRAATTHAPQMRKEGPVSVFYWRNLHAPEETPAALRQVAVPVGPESLQGKAGDEAMGEELRKALKAMGYAH